MEQAPAADFRFPLPRCYVTAEQGVGGRIKVRPEDFLVDEIPLYEPSGEGEHLYVGIEKRRVSHVEMVRTLTRHFGVPESAVGYAGMKDKQGITRQTVSIRMPGSEMPESLELAHERIKVLWAVRHGNKLRRGHLAGNRFSIRIRDVDPTHAPRALAILRQLERSGVPNYFGSQRFGYRCNNHLVGAAVIRADWKAAADELLGSRGSPFPEYQAGRRGLYDEGRYAEALEQWTAADRTERIGTRALANGQSFEKAVCGVGPTTMSFWSSALQSAFFNRVLDRRISDGLFETVVEGDLASPHDKRAVFAVTAGELADPELLERVKRLEVSATGPLWGPGMPRASGDTDAVEVEALEQSGIDLETFLAAPGAPPGSRRPLRVRLTDAMVEGGVDEHGPYVRCSFDLPRGAYATIVMRELMKND